MSFDPSLAEGLIWATRGRSRGFRFLLRGGFDDPLPHFERVFADLDDAPSTWRLVSSGEVALRLADPCSRRDGSGRVIAHEFVVPANLGARIASVEDGRQQVWALVEASYARIWDAKEPPSSADLELSLSLPHERPEDAGS